MIRQFENILRNSIDITALSKDSLLKENIHEKLISYDMVKYYWDSCVSGIDDKVSRTLLTHVIKVFQRIRGYAVRKYMKRLLQHQLKNAKRKTNC